MNKFINLIIAAAFFGSLLLIGWVFYNHYNEENRIEVVLATHENVVRAGSEISIVRADFDQPKNCIMQIEHYLILLPFPNIEFQIGHNQTTTPINHRDENPIFSRELVKIPNEVGAGDYLYYLKGKYYCNPLDYLVGGHSFKSIPLQLKVIK